jgi:energy-coupling factor transporter transmembrane protein EcfT
MNFSINSKKTILHELNILTKLSLMVGISAGVFLVNSLWLLSALLALGILIYARLDIRLGSLKWVLTLMLINSPLTLLVFLLSFGFEEGFLQTILLKGLAQGGLFLSRIYILILFNIIFVATTDLRELTAGLKTLKIPNEISDLIATLFGFLPIMVEEARRIVEIQRMRGLKPLHLMNPAKFTALVIPLLMLNMQRSYEITLSKYLRGNGNQPELPGLKFSRHDAVAFSGMVGLIVFKLLVN